LLFEGNDHRVIDGSNVGLLDDSEESSRDGKDIEISVGSDEDANEGLFVGSEEGYNNESKADKINERGSKPFSFFF